MSRVSLWDEEPEQPRPRRRLSLCEVVEDLKRNPPPPISREEIQALEMPSEGLAGLLAQMTTVLNIKTRQGGPWHARAIGANGYGSGPTPETAMRAALDVRTKEKTK